MARPLTGHRGAVLAIWFLLLALLASVVALVVVVPRDGLGHRPPPPTRAAAEGRVPR